MFGTKYGAIIPSEMTTRNLDYTSPFLVEPKLVVYARNLRVCRYSVVTCILNFKRSALETHFSHQDMLIVYCLQIMAE